MVKDEKDVVTTTNSTKSEKAKRTTKATKTTKTATSKTKAEEVKGATVEATKSEKTDSTNSDKKSRTIRTGLSERALIREKLRDWTADEVRSTQARLNKSMKVLNFKMDPRNAELLNKFIENNGLGKALTVDLAVFRFVSDVEDRGATFPYQALSQIDIQDNENVSFKISTTTKERLDKFCKTNRQQTQLVANIALECFLNEVRNVLEEAKTIQ